MKGSVATGGAFEMVVTKAERPKKSEQPESKPASEKGGK